MGVMYGTCGHKVDHGISLSVDDGNYEGCTYGTYCADCVFEYWLRESIVNPEFNQLIDKICDHQIKHGMIKFLNKIFKEEFIELLDLADESE
jgi:hypothetical protein